jgi:YVTN family beta-propeller protein
MGYANHVGRIGALAVALGVGSAIVGMPGIASAAPDAPSQSDTASGSDSPSGSGGPTDDAGSPPGGPAESTADQEPATETSPTAVRDRLPKSSTGNKRRTTRATASTTRAPDVSIRLAGSDTAKTDAASIDTPKNGAAEPDTTGPEKSSNPVVAIAASATSDVDSLAPQPIPSSDPTSNGLAAASPDPLGLEPSADSIPESPAGTAAAWVLLGWTRKQSGSDEPAAVMSARVVATAPTAAPSQATPDAATGAVAGAINGADVDSSPLIYTVSGALPGKGSVTVNATTGAYTYKPTTAARLAAGVTPGVDVDSFTVTVSNGQLSTTVTVTVPVVPEVITTSASYGTGSYPTGLVVSGTKIYVANASGNSISVIDRTTGAVKKISVAGSPKALALSSDGTRVYVGAKNKVSVINTVTDTVAGTVTLNGGQIYGIEFSPDGKRAYVANSGSGTISVLDATKAVPSVVATITVGREPRGIAVSADGTRAYVTNWGAKSLSVIDTVNNRVVGSPIALGTDPFGVVASADGSRVYVANHGSGTVSVINPNAAAPVLDTVSVGTQPMDLVLSRDGSVLFVANGRDTVSVIGTATNTVTGTVAIDTRPETNSHRISISPDGKQIYITDTADNAVRVLTLTRGNTAPVAGTPTIGTPNATTGVVTGTLSVTDPDGDKLIYTVTSPPSKGTLVVDAAGNYTFTPPAASSTGTGTAAASAAATGTATGTASFTVTVSDGKAGTSTTVTVPVVATQAAVDSTAALQAMFDKLKSGDTLTLDRKTYRYSGVLYIRVSGVTINGNGATLAATNDLTAQLQILADSVTLHDLTMSSPLILARSPISTIYISADHASLRDVTINGSAGAGVYLSGAGYFDLTNVRVIRALADGIHMTNGSHDGVVNNAYTEWTGDDGIAVVSYVSDGTITKNITVNNPVVNGTTWGRGVTVVGGDNVTFNNVAVSNTDGGGVYIATEPSYNTYSVSNVKVIGGTLTNCNTNPAVVHGAVLLWAGNSGTSIKNVTLSDLTIINTPGTATWLLGIIKENGGTVSAITFTRLTLRQAVPVMAGYTNAPRNTYTLNQVLLNGTPLTTL